jgi:hypothetical protein
MATISATDVKQPITGKSQDMQRVETLSRTELAATTRGTKSRARPGPAGRDIRANPIKPKPATPVLAQPADKSPTKNFNTELTGKASSTGVGGDRSTSTQNSLKTEVQVDPKTKITTTLTRGRTQGQTTNLPTNTVDSSFNVKGSRDLSPSTKLKVEVGYDRSVGTKAGVLVDNRTINAQLGVSTSLKLSPFSTFTGELTAGHKSGRTGGADVSENTIKAVAGVSTKGQITPTTSLTVGNESEVVLKNSPSATAPTSTVAFKTKFSAKLEYDTPIKVGGAVKASAFVNAGADLTGAGFIGGTTPATWVFNPSVNVGGKAEFKTGKADHEKLNISAKVGLEGTVPLDGKTASSSVIAAEINGELGLSPNTSLTLKGSVKGPDTSVTAGVGFKF